MRGESMVNPKLRVVEREIWGKNEDSSCQGKQVRLKNQQSLGRVPLEFA